MIGKSLHLGKMNDNMFKIRKKNLIYLKSMSKINHRAQIRICYQTTQAFLNLIITRMRSLIETIVITPKQDKI